MANTGSFAETDQYISNLFNHGHEAAEAALQHSHASGVPAWDISANQGRLLQVFAHMCSARRILEIGTLGGYSTIWMAQALPAGGKVVTLELNPDYAAVAAANIENAGLADKVEIRLGRAIDALEQLHNEHAAPFDMVFIDADKPPYAEYLQWALKLSRPGTIIIADNVIRGGKVLNPVSEDPAVQGARRFNELLAGIPGITATIIQSVGTKEHDGMAVAVVTAAYPHAL